MPDSATDDALQLLRRFDCQDARQRGLRDDFLSFLEAHPAGTRRTCLPDHLTASAIVVDPGRGMVLLGLHRKAGLWLQMGGHIDDSDGSIAAAALRESVEESGIASLRLASAAPIHLDRHAAPCSAAARYHLDVQFLALAPPDSVASVSPEQLELRWCAFDAPAEPTDDAVRALIAAARGFLSMSM